MLNVHLSYKPPGYWRLLFWSGVRPSLVSRLKNFRDLVVPRGGFRKGIIIQGILTPTGVLPNGQFCLRIKGDVTGEYVHVLRHRNGTYVNMVRWYIYETRCTGHPHSPIRRYKQRPQGPTFSAPLHPLQLCRKNRPN